MPDIDFNATNFEELSACSQIGIIVRIMLVLVISVGNTLILATIWFVKKHHTPHGYILFANALLDVFIGVVACPMEMATMFPEFKPSLGIHTSGCVLVYNTVMLTGMLSFDVMTLLCFDRCLSIWQPIWYRVNVKKRGMILTVIGLFVLHIALLSAAIGSSILMGDYSGFVWAGKSCSQRRDREPRWIQIVLWCFLLTEMVLSFGLSIMVAILSINNRKNVITDVRNVYLKTNKKLYVKLVLMSLFLLLWMPTLVVYLLNIFGEKPSECAFSVTRVIRFANSGVNAPIFAISREDFRTAFVFLLTSPPWKWRQLATWLNRHYQQKPSTPIDTIAITKFDWGARNDWKPTEAYNLVPELDTLNEETHERGSKAEPHTSNHTVTIIPSVTFIQYDDSAQPEVRRHSKKAKSI